MPWGEVEEKNRRKLIRRGGLKRGRRREGRGKKKKRIMSDTMIKGEKKVENMEE